jgi:serine protease Do
MKLPTKPLAVLALAAVSMGVGFGGVTLVQNVQFARAEQRVDATREQLSSVDNLASVFNSVSKVLEPSVVNINVRKTVKGGGMSALPPNLRRFFDRDGDGEPDAPGMGEDDEPMIQQGTGSGVIIEIDGSTAYIVTNNHVAGEAEEMEITFHDGRVVKNGKLVGTDPKSDLAVVKVNVDRVIAAKWGDSDALSKGDWVLAFGSPLGYVGSMTHGIVSALHRQSSPEGGVGILGPGGYENFIQVDAPINPGNSGGPLVNTRGEVIGINTAIASRTGGFQGIGFAIPSNQAKQIYEALKKNGKVTRGWLGVEIIDVARDTDAAAATGYTGTSGVLVRGAMRGTPAFGKLQPGDVIKKFNGKDVLTTQELRDQVALTPPKTEVALAVFRGGKTQDVKIMVGEQPDDVLLGRATRRQLDDQGNEQTSIESMGLRLSDPSDAQRKRFGLTDAGDGALVTNVEPGSPAARGGLRAGDLITRVNDKNISSSADAESALTDVDTSKGLTLWVANRDGSRLVFIPADAFGKKK